MAKQELPREDLMAEARALVQRIELRAAGLGESVVVGFRRDGAVSFFFDQDPAYHFNSQRQLRRAYAAGGLYKAERGRLVRLIRQRSVGEVALVRHELSAPEQAAFLNAASRRLRELSAALQANQASVIAVEPMGVGVGVAERVANWLAALGAEIAVAAKPNAM